MLKFELEKHLSELLTIYFLNNIFQALIEELKTLKELYCRKEKSELN